MKQIVLSLMFLCLSAGLWAQVEVTGGRDINEISSPRPPVPPSPNFKPRYAGTSVDIGFMFMPRFGTAYYVAPKLRFQATPRLFVNTGISIVQYNVLPSQTNFEGFTPQRTAVGAYIFAEGQYFLSERWSVSGSAMKRISPQPQPMMRNVAPFRMPNEAMHLGVDFRVTPNITIGARVGYASSGGSHFPY